MDNGAASSALQRIERAFARIDAALSRPASAQANSRQAAELAARHDALRNETRRAIAELDAVIGANIDG